MYKKDDLNLAALYEKNFVKEHQLPLIVVDTEDEEDYSEGASDMAKDQLEFIIRSATHILASLNNGETFEPWVASKITLANDYLSTVAQVIGGEEMDEEDQEEEIHSGGLVTPDTCRATGDGTMA